VPNSNDRKPKGSAHIAAMLQKFDISGVVPGVAPALQPEARKVTDADVLWVEPDRIGDGPFQHDEQLDMEQFERLVESIKSGGFFSALFVNIDTKREGYYYLTAGGHQRREAAKVVGVKVPIFIEPPVDRITLALRSANENIIGVNRSAVNLGHLFIQMLDEFRDPPLELTQEKLAQLLGQNRSWVAARIMAANLDADLKAMLLKTQGERGLRAAIALRGLTPEERAPVIEKFLAGDFTTDMVDRTVKEIKAVRLTAATSSASSPEHVAEPGQLTAPDEGRDGGMQVLITAANRAAAHQPPTLSSEKSSAAQIHPSTQASVQANGTFPVSAERPSPKKPTAIVAREAKLLEILSRMKAYKLLRGRELPSTDEHAFLLQIAGMLEELLPGSNETDH
jgi:ParB/RepB/Spo0J family partition protein